MSEDGPFPLPEQLSGFLGPRVWDYVTLNFPLQWKNSVKWELRVRQALDPNDSGVTIQYRSILFLGWTERGSVEAKTSECSASICLDFIRLGCEVVRTVITLAGSTRWSGPNGKHTSPSSMKIRGPSDGQVLLLWGTVGSERALISPSVKWKCWIRLVLRSLPDQTLSNPNWYIFLTWSGGTWGCSWVVEYVLILCQVWGSNLSTTTRKKLY